MDRAFGARMAQKLGCSSGSLIIGLLWALPGMAYSPMKTSSGAPIVWPNDPNLQMVANPTNQVGLDAAVFQQAMIKGLQRWQAASAGVVQFDYWQGTDSAKFGASVKQDGVSRVFFASQAPSGSTGVGPGVLGLTQVWYKPDTGEILENDMIFNDLQYSFHNDPKLSGVNNSFFIENVITHELGHALGLTHSGVQLSTMIYTEAAEQNHLSCDDQIGIHALYPHSNDRNTRGGIEGTVLLELGKKAVIGIQVVAVSLRKGTVAAAVLTDSAGNFSFAGLEPDEYLLLGEPFFAGGATLTDYFAGLDHKVCNGGYFSRTWVANLVVEPGQTTRLDSWKGVKCTGGGAAFSLPENIVLTPSPLGNFGTVNRVPQTSASNSSSAVLSYSLPAFNGKLELHAVSHSLYSPSQFQIVVKTADGKTVAGTLTRSNSLGDSGFTLSDAVWVATDVMPSANYVIELTPTAFSGKYLGSKQAIDPNGFVVLTGTVFAATTQNPRCKMDESFPPYQNPPATTLPAVSDPTSAPKPNSGFCGTLKSESGPTTPGALASWFFPWVLMLGFVRLRWIRSPIKIAT